MGVNIDWSLGRMPDVGRNALSAFQQGEKMGEQIRRRKAVKAFTDNPDDPKALSSLMEADPDLGFRASEYQRKRRADQKADQFSEAATAYMGGGAPEAPRAGSSEGSELYPSPGPTPRASIGAPATQGMNALAAFTSPQGRWPSPDEAPQLPDSSQQQDPRAPSLVSIVGKPANREDALFLKMFRADPKRALEMESALRDRVMDRLEDEHDAFGYGVAMLSRADANTYAARRAEVIQRFSPLGMNMAGALPEQYPGEEGMRGLLTKGLGLKDQLAALISQDRAEVYADDIDADNARADRNTASIIADRGARRDIQRRGQDIRSTDTRRGQDKRGSGRSGLVRVKTRAEAEALPPGTKFRDPNGVVRTRP